jgi:DNA-binding protein H-NS
MTTKFELAAKRATLKALKLEIASLAVQVKAEAIAKREAKALDREAKAAARETKIAASIAKAEARLQKLLEKKVGAVGAKAVKANKRAGSVKSYNPEEIAEANAIAARIKAAKA